MLIFLYQLNLFPENGDFLKYGMKPELKKLHVQGQKNHQQDHYRV